MVDIYLKLKDSKEGQAKAPNYNRHNKQLEVGDKVKIDTDKIKSRKNYERMSRKYKSFIESIENASEKDKVFTVKENSKGLVTLEEKDIWLFVADDLILVK